MANFQDILNRPADEIKPPPVLPMGSYHTVIVGLPEQGQSSQKKTDYLKFQHKIIAVLEDVDPSAIEEFEAEGDVVVGQTIDNTFYITDKAAFMFKQFVENCGVDLTGKSLAEAIDELPNREVIISIKHESNNDGTRINARVGRTARVE